MRLQPMGKQDFVALPTETGDVLAWNQEVIHYGGSNLSKEPRISLAMEFAIENASQTSWGQWPPVEERDYLIARQVFQYQHMHPCKHHVLQWCRKHIT